jgi:hypothetical protein
MSTGISDAAILDTTLTLPQGGAGALPASTAKDHVPSPSGGGLGWWLKSADYSH